MYPLLVDDNTITQRRKSDDTYNKWKLDKSVIVVFKTATPTTNALAQDELNRLNIVPSDNQFHTTAADGGSAVRRNLEPLVWVNNTDDATTGLPRVLVIWAGSGLTTDFPGLVVPGLGKVDENGNVDASFALAPLANPYKNIIHVASAKSFDNRMLLDKRNAAWKAQKVPGTKFV